MTRRLSAGILCGFMLCLLLVSLANAQGTSLDTGTIRGIIRDAEGNPLPGVNITVSGPAIMKTETAVTNQNGEFRIPLLRVGTYTLTAELPGFKIYKQENVYVGLNATVTLNIALEQSTIAEEVTVTAAAPTVDVKSSTSATSVNSDLIQNLPISRSLGTIATLAPGVVSSEMIKGGTAANTIYNVDGLFANDPDNAGMGVNLDVNIFEEVEVVTGGAPAEVGIASGGYVNVVTKSGGNNFSGLLQGFYNREPWTTVVVPEDQLKSMGLGKPTADIYNYEISGSLGGPIIKDKLWFFANGRYGASKRRSGFVPWTSPLGVFYDEYDRKNHNGGGFLKLTYQPIKRLRISVNGNYRANYLNTRASGLFMPYDCTYTDDPWENYNAFGTITYIVSPTTYLEARVGFLKVSANLLLPNPSQSGEDLNYVQHNYDSYTGYYFGTGDRTNEWIGRPSTQSSLQFTHFKDNFLGGDHEFKAGFELATGACNWASWQANPLLQYWYNGNPYYWRGLYGLDAPHPTYGDGRILIYVIGQTKEESMAKSATVRYSGFAQDSWIIKNRLTINLGLRYDYFKGWIPDVYKGKTAGIGYSLGEAYFKPTYGLNPYDEFSQPGVNPFVKWNMISPRLGLTFDVFGNGKTALKFHIGKFSDWLYAGLISSFNPLRLSSYTFNWWDNNGNQKPDEAGIDSYQIVTTRSPLNMLREYWSQLVDKDLKGSYDLQVSFGVDHQLLPELKVSVSYLYKEKKNMVDDALYDFETGEYWYHPDDGYWVPFTTTVPAIDQFPAQTVNMYFMKSDAPQMLRVLTNIPEGYRKYSGVDIAFQKRYSKGWQLGGSVTISKTWGNMLGNYDNIWGYGAAGNSANWFVNNDGRMTDADRPLVAKLYGTFNLPLGIFASFNFNLYSGLPWQRSVTVYVPQAWATANGIDLNRSSSYGVNTEPQASRRYYTYENCDFRLEKKFRFGKLGSLGVFLDVYNLFGNYFVNINQNPGGTWRPTDNNATTGTYTPSANYKRITSISNLTRVFRLSVRYEF